MLHLGCRWIIIVIILLLICCCIILLLCCFRRKKKSQEEVMDAWLQKRSMLLAEPPAAEEPEIEVVIEPEPEPEPVLIAEPPAPEPAPPPIPLIPPQPQPVSFAEVNKYVKPRAPALKPSPRPMTPPPRPVTPPPPPPRKKLTLLEAVDYEAMVVGSTRWAKQLEKDDNDWERIVESDAKRNAREELCASVTKNSRFGPKIEYYNEAIDDENLLGTRLHVGKSESGGHAEWQARIELAHDFNDDEKGDKIMG